MYRFDLAGYERACELTRSILQKAGITSPPVPIRELCEFHGLKIVEKNIYPRSARLRKKQRIIEVQPGDTLVRRVQVAHELGHWILPDHYPEISHDIFSWCLLSPQEWLADFSNCEAARIILEEHLLPLSIAKKRLRLFEHWHRARIHLTTPKDEIQHGTDPGQSH